MDTQTLLHNHHPLHLQGEAKGALASLPPSTPSRLQSSSNSGGSSLALSCRDAIQRLFPLLFFEELRVARLGGELTEEGEVRTVASEKELLIQALLALGA
jgi:hypothetical protein